MGKSRQVGLKNEERRDNGKVQGSNRIREVKAKEKDEEKRRKRAGKGEKYGEEGITGRAWEGKKN